MRRDYQNPAAETIWGSLVAYINFEVKLPQLEGRVALAEDGAGIA